MELALEQLVQRFPVQQPPPAARLQGERVCGCLSAPLLAAALGESHQTKGPSTRSLALPLAKEPLFKR